MKKIDNFKVYDLALPPSIIYTEFDGNGETTDLSSIGAINEVVNNLTLDDGTDGRIHFNEGVTLNSSFNLDNAIEIGPSYVFVNSTMYSALNKDANITLWNVYYRDPVIRSDGTVCSTWRTDLVSVEKYVISSWSAIKRQANANQKTDTTAKSSILILRSFYSAQFGHTSPRNI